MIPLRDNNPTSSFPIITILLIVINALVFFSQTPVSEAEYTMVPAKVVSNRDLVGIVHQTPTGDLRFRPESPEQIENQPLDERNDIPLLPTPIPLWMTIFTAMFMHANFWHLAGNMLFLWIFGNNVEDALGKARYLLFYLGCGVAAAIAQIAVSPNSLIPTLGASGAIAGVLGAYIVMFPEARVLTLIFFFFFVTWRDISAFWVLAIWIVLQIIPGISTINGVSTGGVAYFAHIGGFFVGALVTLLMGGRALGQKQIRAAGYGNKPKYSR